MKKIAGGLLSDGGKCSKCADGTAASGDSCYFDPDLCSKKCGCGLTCVDQENETGSICKKSAEF